MITSLKNMKNIKKPIIISGIPRSETTALGRILSSIDGFSMIYEPFNLNQGIQHDPNYNKKYSNEYYKLVLTKEEIELIDAFVAEERFELPTFGL